MTNKIHNDKGTIVKEQVSFRVAPEVKELMEQIAASEHRTMANLTEKLVLERLRDIGLLDEQFQIIKKKA
jgi:folate-dependent phosphoribosylglycinamide formyltransferase PurN